MKEKLICTNCNNVIEFDKTKSKDGIVFCNHCTSKYRYEDIKKTTSQIYSSHLQRGQGYMMQQAKYPEACKEFEECLKIKENDLAALCGYIVSKIYGSTFEDLNFKLITDEIEKREIVLNQENTFIILSMFKDLLVGFKQFIKCSINLTKDGEFINEHLFDCYLKGLNDGEQVLEYLKSSLDFMYKEELDDFLETNVDFKTDLENLINDFKDKLNQNYRINKIGDIQINKGKKRILGTNIHEFDEPDYVELSLIPIDEKVRLYQSILIISFGVLILCGLGLLIAYFVSKKKLLLYSELVVIGAGAVLYFLFRTLMKKSY